MSTSYYAALNEPAPQQNHYFNRARLYLLTLIVGCWEVVTLGCAVAVPTLYYSNYEPVVSWPYFTIWLPAAAFLVLHTVFGFVFLGSWWHRRQNGQQGV